MFAPRKACLGDLCFRNAGSRRQIELHRRAMPLLAVDVDVAVRLFDEAVDHAETEPRPLSNVLGGEERLEHLVEQAAGDSLAGVAHRDHDVVAGLDLAAHARVVLVEYDVPGFERQLAAIRHRVTGVESQIENRGRELAGVDQRRRGIVRQHRFDFDLFAKRRAQQPRGVDDQGVDVSVARLQRLPARERQQMPGQISPPRRGGADHVGDLDEFRPILDRVTENFDGAGDHGQNIVEIVRNATRELADRFHLLRLPDLGLVGLDLLKAPDHGLGLAPMFDFLLKRRIGGRKLLA